LCRFFFSVKRKSGGKRKAQEDKKVREAADYPLFASFFGAFSSSHEEKKTEPLRFALRMRKKHDILKDTSQSMDGKEESI